jgi:hypothetical protein
MDIELLAPVFALVFFIFFFYFIFWLLKRNHKKIMEHWTSFARHLNMDLIIPEGKWSWLMGKYPSVNGSYRDMQFTCFMYTRGSGKNQTTYTTFSFTIDHNNGKTLRLYKEGFFSKIGKAFGGQDIQIGHDAFDDNYMIKSNDEFFAKKILNSRIRQLFLRKLPKLGGEFSFENNTLTYNEIIIINNEKNKLSLQNTIAVAVEFAKELQKV